MMGEVQAVRSRMDGLDAFLRNLLDFKKMLSWYCGLHPLSIMRRPMITQEEKTRSQYHIEIVLFPISGCYGCSPEPTASLHRNTSEDKSTNCKNERY